MNISDASVTQQNQKDNDMLLMKLDGSGMVNIDAVDSRLKMSCEYEQEAFTFYAGPRRDVLLGRARELLANALGDPNET